MMNKRYIALLLLGLTTGSIAEFHADFNKLNEELFTLIFRVNAWGDQVSVSGPGSSIEQTEILRAELPRMFERFHIEVLLDAPCGDLNWINTIMPDLNLQKYIGIDIVKPLIVKNIEKFGTLPNCTFLHGDITKGSLPQLPSKGSAILCRDCLPHLAYFDAWAAFKNFKRTGAEFLIISTYPSRTQNYDLKPNDLFNILRFRPMNFQIAPFNFPEPLMIIVEKNTEGGGYIADKATAIWRIADLPIPE